MKFLAGIVALAFLSIQVSGQDSFEDYLLNLQYQVQALHRRYEQTYDTARLILTEYVEDINAPALDAFLGAIENAEAAQQEVSDAVDALPSVGICVTGVVQSFESLYNARGVDLASCSAAALASINELTNEVHRIIDLGSVLSQEAQHLVVSTVSTWNPVEHVEDLSYVLSYRERELEVALLGNQYDIATALEAVEAGITSIPQAVTACAAPIVAAIESASSSAQADIASC